MGEFVKIATEEGIPFRVTSGYRPNSITSNGSRS
nr:MAG TPA: D-alanyl-D-alanine carboxypeptidase [Bacteriophage sp.]DAW45139.1 MAG TPA: D-alanyl-D-alanine carboxypeptidase [Bacteriophage sp.]